MPPLGRSLRDRLPGSAWPSPVRRRSASRCPGHRPLDHGRQRLLGHPARFQEAGEAAALPELRNAQIDRPGRSAGKPSPGSFSAPPHLPVPVATTVAPRPSGKVLPAIGGASSGADLQLYQALGRAADHLARKIRVGGLLDEVAEAHHVAGHRWSLRFRSVSATRPYRNIAGDRLSQNLHHHRGHDHRGLRSCNRALRRLECPQWTSTQTERRRNPMKTPELRLQRQHRKGIDAATDW